MADLTTDVPRPSEIGPNPFWLASAPPTEQRKYNVVPRLQGGLGRRRVEDAVGEGRPARRQRQRARANRRRWGSGGADRRLLGLNNYRADHRPRPLEVNLREIKQVKRDWPDRAMIVSIMVPCEEAAWKAILPLVEETGADGIELNFGCPHGMSERGMGSAVGQVPEYIEMVARWCKQNTRMPVIVKLTPNITDIRYPRARGEEGRRGRGQPDQHDFLHHQRRSRHVQPRALDRRQGLAWRLLRPGGQAYRAQHGGRDRARSGDPAVCPSRASAASRRGATRRSSWRWARERSRSARRP